MRCGTAVLAALVVYAGGANADLCTDTANSKFCKKTSAVTSGWKWNGVGLEYMTSTDCGTASSISSSGLKCMASCGFCKVAPPSNAASGPSVASGTETVSSTATTVAAASLLAPSKPSDSSTPSMTCKDQYKKRACKKLVEGGRQDGLLCSSFQQVWNHPCPKSCGLCKSEQEVEEEDEGDEGDEEALSSPSEILAKMPVETPVKVDIDSMFAPKTVRIAGTLSGSSGSSGDPHLQFADGGSADFRGHDDGIYNMLSSPAVSVNALFRQQDFFNTEGRIQFIAPGTNVHDKAIVHGTFIFETYATVRTASGRVLNMRTTASAADSTSIAMIENGALVAIVGEAEEERVIDDVTIRVRDGKATIATPTWTIFSTVVQTTNAYFINLSFKQVTVDAHVHPHGIIGQSYDGDGIAVDGAKDVYNSVPGGETTTVAQAEGAIEGVYTDYVMASPFATDFKFSRYNSIAAPTRDVRKLSGKKRAKVQAITERRKLSKLLHGLNVAGAE